jgi:Mg-chelatase subunit ChlD
VPGLLDGFDLDAVRFGESAWLWLLTAPGLLLALWLWQLARRLRDRRQLLRRRRVPVRERIPRFGDLLFWLCLLLALASTIVALARPMTIVSRVRTAGVDLVILQDGSASMRVPDVPGDRWRRSMRFLRVLAESLRWERDRLALALFANIATPQVRLTRDPNTFFFFLDHLGAEPPFRLRDDGTWDTNIERGIQWGLRLIDKDEEIRGPSANARAFVLLSDGQAWSGTIETAIADARARQIPLYVIGVGTTAGGAIPDPASAAGNRSALWSSLDRDSLTVIANAGGGRYFELDRAPDAEVAQAIVEATRRRAVTTGVAEETEELYGRCLLIAGGFLLIGLLTQRDRAALTWQVGAAVLMVVLMLAAFRR